MSMLPDNIKREHLASAVAVATTATALIYYWSRSRKNDPFDAFVKPKGRLPYVGHLLCFDKLPGLKFDDWHKQYGPVLRVDMGVQKWILVSDPEIVQHLFVTHGAIASNRPFQLFGGKYYALGKRGIILADQTKKWKHLRTAALSLLSPKMVSQFAPILERESVQLIQELIDLSAASDGEGINPVAFLQRTSLNYALQTGFATRVASSEDPLLHQIIEFIEEGLVIGGVQNDLGGFLPVLKFLDVILRRDKMFRKWISEKRDPLIAKLLDIAYNSDQDNLFKRLRDQQQELGLDDEDLLVTAGDVITGATDTSSMSITWIFAILLHHPEICIKIQNEIDTFIQKNNRRPVFADREEFPYLISVQKEALRFKPLGHFTFFHVLEQDIYYKGYLFPKGASVLPTTLTMQYNPDLYPEPTKFKPERFLNNTRTMQSCANGKLENRDHFLFGWGRRTCPGIHLAEVQMFNILTRVFADCDLKPPASGEIPDLDAYRDGGITVLPPLFKARFVARPNRPQF
ncbi:cytochrome P450 [Phascolomyces articulosus]|uniref:Cytochrome P450 n=1 Tax=Phascolomyces articulosus TaxID=60185 RepID=A0AAD5PIV8_9FUNG|nr:cytochrome P450 [Phascolomyces articulosus]